jgi:hypothetical protein
MTGAAPDPDEDFEALRVIVRSFLTCCGVGQDGVRQIMEEVEQAVRAAAGAGGVGPDPVESACTWVFKLVARRVATNPGFLVAIGEAAAAAPVPLALWLHELLGEPAEVQPTAPEINDGRAAELLRLLQRRRREEGKT